MRDWSGVLLDGRFDVEAPAGSGGMGTVYRGVDRTSGEPIAVKFVTVMERDRRQRFAREVALLASIRHPGVVRYIGDGEVEGQPFLVTEWVEGRALGRAMRAAGFTPAGAVDIVRQLAVALGHVHRAGVIHRDLKPSNVIVSEEDWPRATLIDFGIARSVDDMALTRMGQLVGTPGYFSPEQARGEPRLDARTDVFALGCLAYLLLTGRSAYRAGVPSIARMRVLFEDPPPLAVSCPELPEALGAVVARMLARDGAARLPDGQAVVEALAAVPPVPDEPRRRWMGDEDITNIAEGTPGDRMTERITVVDRPNLDDTERDSAAGGGWPFLVTASPDDEFTGYSETAATLAAEVPDVEVEPVGRQCLVVRLVGDHAGTRLVSVAAAVRSAIPDWPIIGASGFDSLEWAIKRLTVALVAAALAGPDEPAPLVLKE